ncbi:threonine dehydratase [Limimonas halophila]|uniref:Threonine dehydratase n=1 Tax=Limimonas halophila TaxID=1082479 RepID=A0A1G7N2X9_9PROT|nr:threonine ammonia-lyase [Limimonas halophila]SDF68291.1 threonine dehydratase [Limimonas halophila]
MSVAEVATDVGCTLDDIRAAAETLEGNVVRTPLIPASRLSAMLGCEVYLKLENQQYTGSFKDRGSYVKLVSLSDEQKKTGVIAKSAGNHAQGVAYHAQRLGIPATIVMPTSAPFSKVERTRDFGARVIQYGDTIDEAGEKAQELMDAEGLTYVHPYDDPKTLAGQGTIGLEMMADQPELDTIIAPIGGGGVLSGTSIAAKSLNPEVEMIGVEAELFPSMYQHIHGLPATSGGVSLADGIAVKKPGELTTKVIRNLVSQIELVDEASIEGGVSTLSEYQKTVAEGAGAAPLAALSKNRERLAGRKVGLVICGGNIDTRILASVLMRGLVRDGRLVRLRIDITDAPGVLARLSGLIGDTGGNIVEIYHQRLFHDVPVRKAEIDAVVETRNSTHVREIVSALEGGGFHTRVLSSISADGPSLP